MKKIIFTLFSLLFYFSSILAQCDLGNYTSSLPIPIASFPYTNAQSIIVSATIVNIPTYANASYSCGGNNFAGASPAWALTATNQSITFDFSVPVCNFTILVNGTNDTEEFYFNSNNGTISLSNFCTNSFVVIGAGSTLLCNFAPTGTGTIITVNNPAGATQYVLTHNGLGLGSRISLLDCYVGCQPPVSPITCNTPDLTYCEGENAIVNYNVSGTYNAGNVFTAELSDGLGSFAAPTVIGSIMSITNGSIPCTIPLGTLTGTGYRIRVNSSNPVITGSNNGSNITINAFPSVVANATPTSVCLGGNATLSGSGASSYTWTGGISNNVAFTPATTATYTVTGTDAIGCSNTSSIQIVVNPLPVLSINVLPNDTICEGNLVTLIASGASTYTWSGGIQNGIAFSPTSTTTYTVVGVDANTCSNSLIQTITVNPLPFLTLGSDVELCQGDSIVLNATTTNATYLWQNGSQNPTFTAKQTGLYWVSISVGPCIRLDTVQVTVNQYPIIDLGIDTSVCAGKSITLDATCPNCLYLWNDNSSSATLFVNAAGTYSVTATVKGCSSTDTIDVDVTPLPIVDLGLDTAICAGESILLDVTQTNGTYLWQDFTKSPIYTINNIGTYWVEVTVNNCSNRDEIVVSNSNLCNCPVWLPNAFSPNGDLRNDEFKLMNTQYIDLIQFSIYNRWGEEVFNTLNPTVGWEGNFKGSPSELGTYHYMVKYKCLYSGKDYIMKGDVTLIR
jgi:gliding motility-associated-like protein